MKGLNYFVDAHVFDGPYQGSRSYLSGLYFEVIRLLPDIHFVFAARNVDNLKREFGDHANVTYVKYRSSNKFIRLMFDIPMLIKKNKIDISHFQYISPLFKLSAEILTIHDLLFIDYPESFPPWYRFKNRFLFKRSASRANLLLTVSQYSRSRISEHFRIHENDIEVVPNGIPSRFFSHSDSLPDVKSKFGLGKYILCVSRIEPRKNQGMLVEAFAGLKLSEKGFMLVLIGSRSIHSLEFERAVEKLDDKTRNSVLIIEKVSDDELIAFYKNCTLFVYPSKAEGFGIPPLEALASGASVICSRTTAMNEFDFLKERMFDSMLPEELKSKITEYISDNEKYSAVLSEIVAQKFDWKSIAENFIDILHNKGIC